MITLLSPSKTQDFEQENRTDIATQCEFLKDAKQLLEVLQQKSIEELSEEMTISERLSFLVYNMFEDMRFPFTKEDSRQAIVAFKGTVYEGFEVESLSDEDLLFAQQHLRIISGFYGILKPLDLIQPYRLEMKTPLVTARGKNLYQFWGDFLTDHIRFSYPNTPIINLASNEYAKAVIRPSMDNEVVTPVFQDYDKKGRLRTVAVYAKRARGVMARYIIKNKINRPKDIKDFAEEGYHFSSINPKTNEWVFVREHVPTSN